MVYRHLHGYKLMIRRQGKSNMVSTTIHTYFNICKLIMECFNKKNIIIIITRPKPRYSHR